MNKKIDLFLIEIKKIFATFTKDFPTLEEFFYTFVFYELIIYEFM